MSDDKNSAGDFPYEDIVHLPRPVSRRHPRMSMDARAAQFAPFAALTGHEDAINETARRTAAMRELTAEELADLSRKLSYALSFPERPVIDITYFVPDTRKDGGSYVTVKAAIRMVEETRNIMTLMDGTEIALDAVTDLRSPVFDDLEG